MRKAIIFLVLVLIGCASTGKEPLAQKSVDKKYCIENSELDSAISSFTQAIKNNPNYGGAYWNLAKAYFHKKDYNKSWENLYKAESLCYKFDPAFKESLIKASGRKK